MRCLHVAALPFPSPQGTQALLHQMLCALAAAGHETHLLSYAHGDTSAALPYRVHRIPRQGFARSMRSGPSLDKLWLDLSLARTLRRLVHTLRPEHVVAHHVEAAAAALASGIQFDFVAHTSLAAELPVYFAAPLAGLTRRLGEQLDTRLLWAARRAWAVSPQLARDLCWQSGRGVQALPLPWPLPPAITEPERRSAREALGLVDAEVALYAGNLDAYQGLGPLLAGLSAAAWQRPRLRLVVATAAPHARLAGSLQQLGLAARTTFLPLHDEPARRLAHAAADLALVPRLSPGGVPIKLLDALARGVPVLAAARALAGLPLAQHCTVVDGDDAGAWQRGLQGFPERCTPGRIHEARSYVERAHAGVGFVQALMRG
jgi:glycosyltransferase involved in cell wall biosynthesis